MKEESDDLELEDEIIDEEEPSPATEKDRKRNKEAPASDDGRIRI